MKTQNTVKLKHLLFKLLSLFLSFQIVNPVIFLEDQDGIALLHYSEVIGGIPDILPCRKCNWLGTESCWFEIGTEENTLADPVRCNCWIGDDINDPEFHGETCQLAKDWCTWQKKHYQEKHVHIDHAVYPCGIDDVDNNKHDRCHNKPQNKTGYYCDCPTYQYGTNCQFLHPCHSNPCNSKSLCQAPDFFPDNNVTNLLQSYVIQSYDETAKFTCKCPETLTGPYCDKVNEDCRTNSILRAECLQNGGDCPLNGNGICECPIGRTGLICENDIDECSSNPCKNTEHGAICKNMATPNMWICECPEFFYGEDCNIHDSCHSSPCLFGGKCQSSSENLLYNYREIWTCKCPPGRTGLTCEIYDSRCSHNPLKKEECQHNDGNCDHSLQKCICPNGKEGELCEIDISECASRPCINGGICHELIIGSYQCDCPNGFYGDQCEINNECVSNPCKYGGVCVDGELKWTCQCPDGKSGLTCEISSYRCTEDIDTLATCENNGGTCNHATKNCDCPDGREGWSCERDIDPCDDKHNPCLKGHGSCFVVNSIGAGGSNVQKTASCQCDDNYQGEYCEDVKDSCLSSPCHHNGKCTSSRETYSYTCECVTGTYGKNCQYDKNECVSQPCLNNGRCIESGSVNTTVTEYDQYACECHPEKGTLGTHCENFKNACNSSPCQNMGICVPGNAYDYTCSCYVGTEGDHCEFDVDECASNPCLNSGNCKQYKAPPALNLNKFVCECPDGFVGPICGSTDLSCNATSSTPHPIECENGSECEKGLWETRKDRQGTDYSYFFVNPDFWFEHSDENICHCSDEFVGPTCSKPNLACQNNPAMECSVHGRCLDIAKQEYINGVVQERDDLDDTNHWFFGQNGNNYIDIYGNSHRCVCDDGWFGPTCDDPNPCHSNPCLHGATCTRKEDSNGNPQNIFTCDCLPKDENTGIEYEGVYCHEIKTDECLIFNLQCQNNGICVDGYKNWTCQCTAGWIGDYCELVDTRCSHNPKYLKICEDQNFANCLRDQGICQCPSYREGTYCEKIIDACSSNPCQNGALKCSDWIASSLDATFYECTCKTEEIIINQVNGPSNQTTYLRPLFEGTNCESANVDQCGSNPCGANGICLDLDNSWICRCNYGWIGNSCQYIDDACNSSPCKNNGTCHSNFGKPNMISPEYICECDLNLYEGTNCEKQNIDQCSISNNIICQNQGTCVDKNEDFFCDCTQNFKGRYCESSMNACDSNPCQNNGKCERSYDKTSDSWFACNCDDFHEGKFCEISCGGSVCGNECSSNPCSIFGKCVDGVNSWECQCQPGYSGLRCDKLQNPCDSNPCLNNAVCEQTSPNVFAYHCTCPIGWTGPNCNIKINACDSNPCFQHRFNPNTNSLDFSRSTCVNFGDNSWRCECGDKIITDSYILNRYISEDCSKINGFCNWYKQSNFDPNYAPKCEGGSICRSDPTDPDNYFCVDPEMEAVDADDPQITMKCPENRQGRLCEIECFNNDCEEHDVCKTLPCKNKSTCLNLGFGSYTCLCPFGFYGENCDKTISYCDHIPAGNQTYNLTSSNQTIHLGSIFRNYHCNYQGSCVSSKYSFDFECKCFPGYEGKRCEKRIDYCFSNPCGSHGICQSVEIIDKNQTPAMKLNSFTCTCEIGYSGPFCNQIHDPCGSSPCQNNAACLKSNENFSYQCHCLKGFEGVHCEKQCPGNNNNCVDECLSSPCKNGGTCINLENSFRCLCPTKTMEFTGEFCEVPLNDPCKDSRIECQHNTTCVVAGRIRYTGQILKGNDRARCDCSPGLAGRYCEIKIDPCLSQPCGKRGGQCFSNLLDSNFDNYICICPVNWTGTNCEIIDNRACDSNPCNPHNTKSCVPIGESSYKCECKNTWYDKIYYKGINCEEKCPDLYNGCDRKCQSESMQWGWNPCANNGVCIEDVDDLKCVCPAGTTNTTCFTPDPCYSNPCQFGGTCRIDETYPLEDRWIFECECSPGTTGVFCESFIRSCATKPCKNGGICSEKVGGVSCFCMEGYSGDFCENIDDPCQSNPCQNNGICKTSFVKISQIWELE